VAQELEETIKKAPSFEDALRQAVELMKRRFARYSSVTAYVADGEELAVHIALERPQGPDRVGSTKGPLAEAAQGPKPTVVSTLASSEAWADVGFTAGSAMVAPIRTEAGLWAILEVWSDFRDAFSAPDAKLLERVTQALAKKTPAA
jgi:putative methionine-R-sulfoxide reductase with GAF domain